MQFIGNQGRYGEATSLPLKIAGALRSLPMSDVVKITVVLTRFDPLTQTFTLSESRHIGGIDLWFSNRGAKSVVVQIRDTSLGMPTQNVIAEGSIIPASINVKGTFLLE